MAGPDRDRARSRRRPAPSAAPRRSDGCHSRSRLASSIPRCRFGRHGNGCLFTRSHASILSHHRAEGLQSPGASIESADLTDPELLKKLDRLLIAKADLLGKMGIGRKGENRPRLDAHLPQTQRLDISLPTGFRSPAVETSTAMPDSAIASTAGS